MLSRLSTNTCYLNAHMQCNIQWTNRWLFCRWSCSFNRGVSDSHTCARFIHFPAVFIISGHSELHSIKLIPSAHSFYTKPRSPSSPLVQSHPEAYNFTNPVEDAYASNNFPVFYSLTAAYRHAPLTVPSINILLWRYLSPLRRAATNVFYRYHPIFAHPPTYELVFSAQPFFPHFTPFDPSS